MPGASELHRRLLTPLLPAGIAYEDLPPLFEADEERGAVLDSPDRLRLRKTLPLQSDYEELIGRQVVLKTSYAGRVLSLVDDHAEGRASRSAALKAFEADARATLTSAFTFGVAATAEGDGTTDPAFRRWLEDRVAFEASRFGEFLDRAKAETEIMPREKRAELYGRTVDSAFNRGGLAAYGPNVRIHWRLTQAEHCSDCLAYAAEGPYLPPGTEDDPSDLLPLPAFPREGRSECLGNCKCYLQVEKREPGDEEPTYEAADRVVTPSVVIEDGDEASLSDYSDDELADFQTRADGLEAEAQWARAMYDATGDEEYAKRRTDAYGESIALQDETGLRFVPRSRSDTVSRGVQEAIEAGYEPVLPKDKGKLAPGVEAVMVDGGDSLRGMLSEWDQKEGTGTFEEEDGETYPIDDLSGPPYVVAVRGLESWVDRPWKIPDVPAGGFVAQIPGKQASFAEETRCGPELEEADSPGCDPIKLIGRYRETLDSMPPDHSVGMQLRVVRRQERERGAVAELSVEKVTAYAAAPLLVERLVARVLERRLTVSARLAYDAAARAAGDGGYVEFEDAYARWLTDDETLSDELSAFFTDLEGDPDALNDPFYGDDDE